jgi:hypothetical protein
MPTLDASMLCAIATLISSVATLVWSFRRKT